MAGEVEEAATERILLPGSVGRVGGGGGIRGCGERGGFWGVTGLNYPRGVPSVGAVTRFQSRAALFERRRGARRRDVFGGEKVSGSNVYVTSVFLFVDLSGSVETHNSRGKYPAVAIRAASEF